MFRKSALSTSNIDITSDAEDAVALVLFSETVAQAFFTKSE